MTNLLAAGLLPPNVEHLSPPKDIGRTATSAVQQHEYLRNCSIKILYLNQFSCFLEESMNQHRNLLLVHWGLIVLGTGADKSFLEPETSKLDWYTSIYLNFLINSAVRKGKKSQLHLRILKGFLKASQFAFYLLFCKRYAYLLMLIR